MIILSVDRGKARTGIAYSDESGAFAFPDCVITEYNEDKLVDKICERIALKKASLVVVGLPKRTDGTLGDSANECISLAEKIKEKSLVETVMWDERFTTVSALNALKETGTFGKKRKAVVDAVAATMILEDYLKYRKANNL